MPEWMDEQLISLLDTMLLTNDLAALVDRAAAVLQNPVLVCDSSYHILYASTIHTVQDERWQLGIKRGHWTYDFVATIHSLGIDHLPGGHSQPIVVEGVSEHRRRLTKLTLDQVDLGYTIVLESHTPFDSVPERYYEMVNSILAKEMSRSGGFSQPMHSCESILSDLLHSGFPSRQLFLARIHGSEFDRRTVFRVFVIDLTNYIRKTVTEEDNLKAQIGRCLPFSWSVYDKKRIVVLIDIHHRLYQQQEDLLADFSVFLDQRKIRAGLSAPFEDLYLFSGYKDQAAFALEAAALFQDPRALVPYSDYNLIQIISDLPRHDALYHYCTDSVLHIEQYDAQNKTEYLDTLFYYLQTDRSVQATSQRMHLHRNTINYRIDRIRELFGINFDDTRGNYQHYISCLILMYRSRRDQAKRRT